MTPTCLLGLAMVLALAAQPRPGRPGQRAWADLSRYFGAGDYPVAALRSGAEGTVGFRLVIGADGRVAACAITGSSGSKALDAGTCAIIVARARYRPATDARGNPTQGHDSGRVTWVFPEDEEEAATGPFPRPPRRDLRPFFNAADYPLAAIRAREQGRVSYRVKVDRRGRVSHCIVTRSSGSASLDEATCTVFRRRILYAPARDSSGRAVAGVDEGRVTWRLPD